MKPMHTKVNWKIELIYWESSVFLRFYFIIIFIVCLSYLHKMQHFTLILVNVALNMISSYIKIYIIPVFMFYRTFIRNPKNARIINFYFFPSIYSILLSDVILSRILSHNIILQCKQIEFCYFSCCVVAASCYA